MADAFERCGTYEPNSRKRRQVHLYEAQGQNELEFGRSIERETGDYELKAHWLNYDDMVHFTILRR